MAPSYRLSHATGRPVHDGSGDRCDAQLVSTRPGPESERAAAVCARDRRTVVASFQVSRRTRTRGPGQPGTRRLAWLAERAAKRDAEEVVRDPAQEDMEKAAVHVYDAGGIVLANLAGDVRSRTG